MKTSETNHYKNTLTFDTSSARARPRFVNKAVFVCELPANAESAQSEAAKADAAIAQHSNLADSAPSLADSAWRIQPKRLR